MFSPRLDHVRSILCLGAHADDIEIGCGGTLLDLLARNPAIEVHWVVLAATEQRSCEAQASAERFLAGVKNRQVVIKNFRDSYFPAQYEAIKTCFEQIRARLAPDLVFTHRLDDAHQDHRLVAELTWCAFRDHLVLEYEIPKYEGDLGRPNVYMPLAEDVCRRKVENLLECFPSQRARPWFTADTYWALLRLRGIECNSPSGFAEGLYARKMTLAFA
jgi:LmbE family N-acetylglucosaminyl deacetylase